MIFIQLIASKSQTHVIHQVSVAFNLVAFNFIIMVPNIWLILSIS